MVDDKAIRQNMLELYPFTSNVLFMEKGFQETIETFITSKGAIKRVGDYLSVHLTAYPVGPSFDPFNEDGLRLFNYDLPFSSKDVFLAMLYILPGFSDEYDGDSCRKKFIKPSELNKLSKIEEDFIFSVCQNWEKNNFSVSFGYEEYVKWKKLVSEVYSALLIKKEQDNLISIEEKYSFAIANDDSVQISDEEFYNRLLQDTDLLTASKTVNEEYHLFIKAKKAGIIKNSLNEPRLNDALIRATTLLTNALVSEEKQYLARRYGELVQAKQSFRKNLDKTRFDDALSMLKDYSEKERCIIAEMNARKISGACKSVWDEYSEFFHYGIILINDHLNKINKNKAKNKSIPQNDLDNAMVYFYDSSSAEEAYAARNDIQYKENKEAGNAGEKRVKFALQWLDRAFIQIEPRSKDKIGEPCIIIKNEEFIDLPQEYDHIIVSCKGLFVIETKNYQGTIIIDTAHNWIREFKGERLGEKNPIQQVRQHEKLLKSFLPEKINLVSIICIANDQAIIEGQDNCEIPIVKSDRIVEYIENYKANDKKVLSEEECKKIAEMIYEHMVK